MPSEQSLNELASAFEKYQQGLEQRIASTTPDNPMLEHIKHIQTVLAESMSELMTKVKEHNQQLANTVIDAQESLKNAKDAIEEKKKNVQKPKGKITKAKSSLDPFLEEKLNLALNTPFGNRGNH